MIRRVNNKFNEHGVLRSTSPKAVQEIRIRGSPSGRSEIYYHITPLICMKQQFFLTSPYFSLLRIPNFFEFCKPSLILRGEEVGSEVLKTPELPRLAKFV